MELSRYHNLAYNDPRYRVRLLSYTLDCDRTRPEEMPQLNRDHVSNAIYEIVDDDSETWRQRLGFAVSMPAIHNRLSI